MLGVTLAGFFLRLWYIGQPMRYDEAVTYLYFSSKSWLTVVSSYTYPNNHVFHSVLVKAAVTVFGNAPWAIRLPAFLAGVALIPMTFVVARRLASETVALIAAALVAASGALVLYATNARGYDMMALETLFVLYALLRLRERSSFPVWILVAVAATLGAWTVPVMLYPAGGLALWFAFAAWRGKTSGGRSDIGPLAFTLLASLVLTALLYAPIMAENGVTALTSNSFVRPSDWATFMSELGPGARDVLLLWTLGVPRVVGVLLAALAAYGLFARQSSDGRLSMALPMAVWCGAVLIVTHRVPFARVWLFLVPLAEIAAARGLAALLARVAAPDTLAKHRGVVAGVTFAVAAGLVIQSRDVLTSRETGTLPDADAVAQTLVPLLRPGDRVFAPIPSNAPLVYAFVRAGADTSHFSRQGAALAGGYLVVNTGEGQSMQTPVIDPEIKNFPQAARIAAFSSAELYRLVRRQDRQTP